MMGLAAGCERRERFPVVLVALAGDTASDNAVLDLPQPEIQALFQRAVAAHGGFVLPAQTDQPREDETRLALDLQFTRFIQRDTASAPVAEVGSRVVVVQGKGTRTREYEAWGAAEVALPNGEPAERRDAARAALEHSLKVAVAAAHLQLVAVGKKDAALVKDLESPSAAQRDAAVRVLSDRLHPAAVTHLIARLQSEDATLVRRTIGQLVELRDRRAVEPLIELARGQHHGFLREILYAVGAIGGEEAEAYLDTVAVGHDQAAIRTAAAEALSELRARASGKLGAGPTAENREGNAR